MDNIRHTKANFQLLMEESKMKLQIPSSPLTDPIEPIVKSESETLPRRSSKVESDVFKNVEQTRRNSRTDRKNFGRYFTADGTGSSNSSSSSTITKRMSWNNDRTIDKRDSSLITNSFRSVHSSSGVSSTGSFLFSTDEDSSLSTTTPSSSSILPLTTNTKEMNRNEDEILVNPTNDSETKPSLINVKEYLDPSFPVSSALRRTPYPSVKRRHTRPSVENSTEDHRDSSSMNGSGNESDYDNNLPLITSVSTEEEQKASQSCNSSPSDTSSRSIYQSESTLTQRLIDIRSHLLLNTTLDAT